MLQREYRRYYCAAGVKKKKRKKEEKKVVKDYFPLGRDWRNSGRVSFWPEDGIIFPSSFPNYITCSRKASAFKNILLRSLSRILHRCLWLKPERKEGGNAEIWEAKTVLSGKRENWLGQKTRLVTTKSSPEVSCNITAKKAQGLKILFCYWAFHTGAKLPQSSNVNLISPLQNPEGTYAPSPRIKERMKDFFPIFGD